MLLLRKEAQDLANATVTEVAEVSQEEKQALYRLILQKKNTAPRRNRLSPPPWAAAA